jgi:hypothetical protein
MAWQACTRSSKTSERDGVGVANRRSLARYARTEWEVGRHLQLLPALAQPGIWARRFAGLQAALDVESNVDCVIHIIDSTTV